MIPFFENFPDREADWLDAGGPASDIVVSTRVRLARNLETFPFPHHASAVELGTIFGDLARRLPRFPEFSGGWLLDMDQLEPNMRRVLQEMNLASPALVKVPQHRGLVLSPRLDRAVMINEKDHIHLVAFRAGFDPSGALVDVLRIDSHLEQEVEPAFAEDLGYLTASPADVGTGLHVSSLIHLPGLVLAGEIDKVLNALRQLQFSVRGLLGEGSTVRGALFRIANLVTLGKDEQEIAEDFQVHVGKIIIYERSARDQLYARDPLGIEDMVHRSLATVRQSRLITAQETFDHLSNIRLGAGLGVLEPLQPGILNRVLMQQQAGHLEMAAGRPLASREKSAARAALLREVFAAE
ncbi:MAG: ATP--guanido phosphotransferase [Candidatus Krumholzibacteria bacterium]|nr:ATP--guanido phosphotransferase [Candidatus Krumholzibacteria bacterium]